MTKAITFLTLWASSFLMVYLCGAFICWDFNLMTWEPVSRFWLVWGSFMAAMATFALISIGSFDD